MMEAKNIYLNQVRDLVLKELQDQDLQIFVFGSRACGNFHPGSDVDIGIIPKGVINARKISLLKEILEESNVPYKVDIVNFAEVSEEFRRQAMQKTIIWKN